MCICMFTPTKHSRNDNKPISQQAGDRFGRAWGQESIVVKKTQLDLPRQKIRTTNPSISKPKTELGDKNLLWKQKTPHLYLPLQEIRSKPKTKSIELGNKNLLCKQKNPPYLFTPTENSHNKPIRSSLGSKICCGKKNHLHLPDRKF